MMFCAGENKRAITLMTMMTVIRVSLGVNEPSSLLIGSPHCPDARRPRLIGQSQVLMVTEVESSPN